MLKMNNDDTLLEYFFTHSNRYNEEFFPRFRRSIKLVIFVAMYLPGVVFVYIIKFSEITIERLR